MSHARRHPHRAAVSVGAAVLALVSGASAETPSSACPTTRPWMPIALTLGPADFGAPPPACSQGMLGLDARVAVFISPGAFYGTLAGEGVLSASLPLGAGFWLSGAVTLVRYEFVQNASVIASATDFGPSTVGLHWGPRVRAGRLSVSPYVRALLPTDTGGEYATTLGAEVGIAALYLPFQRVSVMWGASLPMTVTRLGDRRLVGVTPRASIDVAMAVTTWLEPVLGVEARVGSDPDSALEFVAAKAALRWRPWRPLRVQAAVIAPLAGLERTNLRAALSVSYAW